DASVVFSSGGPYLEIKGNTPQADIDIRITVPEDITPGTYDLETSKPGSHAVLVPEEMVLRVRTTRAHSGSPSTEDMRRKP
ncbi:MAG: hypothetical protein ACLFSP_12765, partial [Spirochaetaceae bacterium]